MADLSRTVDLRDLRGGSADDLHYDFPDGEYVLRDHRLDLAGFQKLRPRLRFFGQAVLTLCPRQVLIVPSEILITSKRTVHEATLFGLDDDPHAGKLFGKLR